MTCFQAHQICTHGAWQRHGGTLEHILSCSTRALGDGWYRWRNDHVLKTIAETISTGLEWAKQFRPSKKTIAFVRAGDKPTPVRITTSAGILMSARDWQLLVDLEHQLKFPSHSSATTLRPDIVVVSESTKQAAGADSPVGSSSGRRL